MFLELNIIYFKRPSPVRNVLYRTWNENFEEDPVEDLVNIDNVEFIQKSEVEGYGEVSILEFVSGMKMIVTEARSVIKRDLESFQTLDEVNS